jgi:hypothetical protein
VACQLDSSGSSLTHTEVTSVQAKAMLSVRHSEMATKKFDLELKSAASHYSDNISPVLANTVLLL